MTRAALPVFAVSAAGAALLLFIYSRPAKTTAPTAVINTTPPGDTSPTAPQETASAITRAEMHNVNYHFDSSLKIHIRRLHGKLVPARSSVPPTFDDKRS